MKTKRLLSIICCAAIILTMTACGGGDKPADEDKPSQAQSQGGGSTDNINLQGMSKDAPLGESVGGATTTALYDAFVATDNALSGTITSSRITYTFLSGTFTNTITYNTTRTSGGMAVKIDSTSAEKAPPAWYIMQSNGDIYTVDETNKVYQKTTKTKVDFDDINQRNMAICSGMDAISTNLYVTGTEVTLNGKKYLRYIQSSDSGISHYVYVNDTNKIEYVVDIDGSGNGEFHHIQFSSSANSNIIDVSSLGYTEAAAQTMATQATTLANIETTAILTEDIPYFTTTSAGDTPVFTGGFGPGGNAGTSLSQEVVTYTDPIQLPGFENFTIDAPLHEEITSLKNVSTANLVSLLSKSQIDEYNDPSVIETKNTAFVRDTTPLYCHYLSHEILDTSVVDNDMEFVLNSTGGRAYKYWDKNSDLGFSSWAIETTGAERTTINRYGEKEEASNITTSAVVDYFTWFTHYKDVSIALKDKPYNTVEFNVATINNSVYLRATVKTFKEKASKSTVDEDGNDTRVPSKIEQLYFSKDGYITYVVTLDNEARSCIVASCAFSSAINADLFDLSTFGGPKIDIEEAVETTAETTEVPVETTVGASESNADTTQPPVEATEAGTTAAPVTSSPVESTTSATTTSNVGGVIIPSFTEATTTTTTAATTAAPAGPVDGYTPDPLTALSINVSSSTPLGEVVGDTAQDNFSAVADKMRHFPINNANCTIRVTTTKYSGGTGTASVIGTKQNSSDCFYFATHNGETEWLLDIDAKSYSLDASTQKYKMADITAVSRLNRIFDSFSFDEMTVAAVSSCTLNNKVYTRYGLVHPETGVKCYAYCTPTNFVAYVYCLQADKSIEVSSIETSTLAESGYFALPAGYTYG